MVEHFVQYYQAVWTVLGPITLYFQEQIHVHGPLQFVHWSPLYSGSPFGFLKLFPLVAVFHYHQLAITTGGIKRTTK